MENRASTEKPEKSAPATPALITSSGSDGKGKACKNMRRLYIMMDNRPDIYLLTVPPTSIKDVNKALKKIMGQQHIPYSRMIVTFKLNVVENADKIKYSR